MSSPFSFSGALNFPTDLGVPPEMVNIVFASNFDQFTWSKADLVGSGTYAVGFGNILTAAKMVLIKVDPSATAAPVNLRWNGAGASGEQEVSPGGFFVLGSGSPVAGLTSLNIVYTTNVTVRVLLLG